MTKIIHRPLSKFKYQRSQRTRKFHLIKKLTKTWKKISNLKKTRKLKSKVRVKANLRNRVCLSAITLPLRAYCQISKQRSIQHWTKNLHLSTRMLMMLKKVKKFRISCELISLMSLFRNSTYTKAPSFSTEMLNLINGWSGRWKVRRMTLRVGFVKPLSTPFRSYKRDS